MKAQILNLYTATALVATISYFPQVFYWNLLLYLPQF